MALPEGTTRQGEQAPPVSSAGVAAVPVGQVVAGAPAAVAVAAAVAGAAAVVVAAAVGMGTAALGWLVIAILGGG